MVLDSFWFLHLNLRVGQGTGLLHLLLFVRGYTVRPVTRMNLADRHKVISGGVPSQLVKMQIFPGHAFNSFGVYASWSVNLPHQIGKQLTVPSLVLYACVRSPGCFLFSVTPLSLALATEVNGNTSPTVLNGISWGAISADSGPSCWWIGPSRLQIL